MRFRPLVSANSDGTYTIRLDTDERDMLRTLLPQLRDLITERDSAAWRLFPNAYQDDPDSAAEYEEMVGDQLRDGRLNSIAIVERTLDATELNADQLQAWMGAVNDLRLVLGTRLDVTEDSEVSDYNTNTAQTLFAAYSYLGYVLESIVTAITE